MPREQSTSLSTYTTDTESIASSPPVTLYSKNRSSNTLEQVRQIKGGLLSAQQELEQLEKETNRCNGISFILLAASVTCAACIGYNLQ